MLHNKNTTKNVFKKKISRKRKIKTEENTFGFVSFFAKVTTHESRTNNKSFKLLLAGKKTHIRMQRS